MEWSRSIEVQMDQGSKDAIILVNVVRFSRVLANLFDNAARASADSGNRKIRLTASLHESRVEISVDDNGTGFRKRPKAHRSGWDSTGLGLVFVKEVVRDHGGSLSFRESSLGGASVRITLPLAGPGTSGSEEE
jgi:C4-dicarboxylate-specific signal transduction histidine kinase